MLKCFYLNANFSLTVDSSVLCTREVKQHWKIYYDIQRSVSLPIAKYTCCAANASSDWLRDNAKCLANPTVVRLH